MIHETSFGKIRLCESGGFLVSLEFMDESASPSSNVKENPVLKKAFQELEEYFAGKLKKFTSHIKPEGTIFQKRVWTELLKIPYGKTASYKDIAINIGNSKAMRAVGLANNKNPLPIFIPCHRVIGANGKLVGYNGGMEIKQKLLQIEGAILG